MRRFVVVAVVAGLLAGPALVQAQQVNTTDGSSQWGDGSVRVHDGLRSGPLSKGWGQVFEVPTVGTFLDSFSFWMRQRTDYGNSLFRAHLATWNDATNEFSDFWVSPERNVTSPLASWDSSDEDEPLSAYSEQAFAPGIQLEAGGIYLAYVEVSRALDWVDGWAGDRIAWRETAYDGTTGLVKLRNGSYANKWDNWDAAFTASFTTVTPEPATFLLLASGLLGIAGMSWARRRRDG